MKAARIEGVPKTGGPAANGGSAIAGIALVALLASACGCGSGSDSPPADQHPAPVEQPKTAGQSLRVRPPAVAGLFYPAEASVLSKTLDGLLERAPAHYIPHLRALVCPHAGYEFSGSTAAVAYKTLIGRPFETVVVMGPSHYAYFHLASIPDADVYETPLGKVPISEKAAALLKVFPFVLEPRCPVQRPDWWTKAPRPAPAVGEDTPETWEHSVEVQVPFLQKTLPHAKILPIVIGNADPEQIAKGLAGILDDRTLVVASSDLSHYHPYDDAKKLDSRCVDAICRLDTDDMKSEEACGKLPILALMHLARQKGWKTRLLDCKNSGDVTGQKDRVVGYSAIAFYEPTPEKVSDQERKFLLTLARKSLLCAATNGAHPDFNPADVSPNLSKTRACFVTLTENGALRGCIGHILPQEPLYQAVMDNTQNAARRDPRFPPVQADEVDKIKIEVSVLTEPQTLPFASPEELLSKLKPYEDGVLLKIGSHGATFLPQVWAQIPEKADFLNQLSLKAGCAPSAWRGGDTSVSIYHVESFEEPD
jgi:hypothetical protein